MDEKKDMIVIKNAAGEQAEAEVVMSFDVEDSGKSYIVYKFASEADNNLTTIHTSVLKEDKMGEYTLGEITDDNEWKIVKQIMKNIIDNTEEA